jgi:CHAT domain-containing protein
MLRRLTHASRWKVVAIWIALVLAGTATLTLLVRSTASSTADLDELVSAVGSTRSIAPRLSGGFRYAPIASRTRSAVPATFPPDVQIAVARIEKRAAEKRTPERLGALGVAYLSSGHVDQAVSVLEEAAEQSASAPVLGDLAAAYLERASAARAQDYARALTAAERATRRDPHRREALFNKALALEALSLRDQARDAWQAYVDIDKDSGWSREARAHAKALTADAAPALAANREAFEAAARLRDQASMSRLANESPSQLRAWLEEQLTATWPKLVLDGHVDESEALLTRLRPFGETLLREHDDAFFRDAFDSILRASGDPRRLREVATAHQLYRSANDAFDNDRIAESSKLARRSLPHLERTRSPFAGSARRFVAIGSYYSNDLGAALQEIGGVAAFAASRRYQSLLGQSHRLGGLVHVARNELAEGLDEYRASLQAFTAGGDVEREAAIQQSLAEDFHFLGDSQQSWSAWYAALGQLNQLGERRNRHLILQSVASALLLDDLPEASLCFQQATLDNALLWGRPPAVITAYLNRAETYSRLGQLELAKRDLENAKRYLADIQDPLLTSRNEARILVAEGETTYRTRPSDAVKGLSTALAYFERTGASTLLASVFLARGRAHLAGEHQDLAEADFRAGIQVFERTRSSLNSESLRSSYFEQPWDLFTEMIRLQADRRDGDRALSFAEQARARTLLEAVKGRGTVPEIEAPSSRVVPPGTAMVYYATLDDRLLIWVIKGSGKVFVDTRVRQTDLFRLVERYRAAGGVGGRDNASLMTLYDILIRPVHGSLADSKTLVIVPDGVLHAVPFAALIRREDHRYLVEDHAIETTPSLTMFGRSERVNSSRGALASALVVGNPQIEGQDAALPEAEHEATEIAALYPKPDLLIDADATKARFLGMAGDHDVIHFAGHGISNDNYPALSRLLLAGSTESTRSLFGQDIAAMHFDRTRLVVLAACRTSAGRIRRGEGVFSLARPFIAAGVPTVVASLWDIDDRASRSLFVSFHRGVRRGDAIVDALRSAQLTALADPDPILRDPANWASITVIGGLAALEPSGPDVALSLPFRSRS